MALVNTFCGLAVLGLVADVVPAAGPVDAVGRLSLDAVLILGVTALWRSLEAKDRRMAEEREAFAKRVAEKDAQLVAMATKVTEVMTQVLDAVKELRRSVDDLADAQAPVVGIGSGRAAGAGK